MESLIIGVIVFITWIAVMMAAVVSSPRKTMPIQPPTNRPMVLTKKEGW